MSRVILTMKSLYKSLSKSEKELADFIVSNEDRIPFLSVYEIARESEVSVATISRFVRKIGYDTFKDFKVELAKNSAPGDYSFYKNITPNDTKDELVKKVFLGNIKSLEDTLKIIDIPRLIEAAKIISGCKRLIFIGIGSSGNISKDAAMRFSFLGFHAFAYNDPTEILYQTSTVSAHDVVVGIAHSGRTSITVKGLSFAKQNNAKTIGIANYMHSPLHSVSEYFFCTSFPESKVKVAALSSRIAQFCIIDALYILAALESDFSLDHEMVNRRIEENLRIREK